MQNCKRLLPVVVLVMLACTTQAQKNILAKLTSPILFKGNNTTAYRDPAALYVNGVFYLYFTLVEAEKDGKIYSYTAMSTSKDLKQWSPVKKLTPKDQSLDYCSPGNVIWYKGEYIMCLQTYPRPAYTVDQQPRFGTGDARLYTMRSKDLVHWTLPELLMVKGPSASFKEMGRMIDPYLVQDVEDTTKWWCFYKQNGVSMSYSTDMVNWTFFGYTESGENACVLVKDKSYILFHSPKNGIGIKTSSDLKNWKDVSGLITLGQQQWPWAKGRLTGGVVLDLQQQRDVRKYIMFFHGSGPLTEEQGDFDKNASIGIGWSSDLQHWSWPGK